MNAVMKRTLCRLLIVLMAWTPFHLAHAGLISTDQAIGSAQVDRATVMNLLQRSDVAGQLQAFGVDLSTARDRVASLTDQEVQSLAGKLHAAPAGADGSGLAILILVGVILWLVFWRR